MLPLLYTLFPNHPALLPAFYDDPKTELGSKFSQFDGKTWVSKPLFGREGAGVFRSNNFTNYDAFVSLTAVNFGGTKENPYGKSIFQ
jgi:glutathionylspermidine synthase